VRPTDLTPPPNVSRVAANPGDHIVQLTWRAPGRDVARVAITQSVTGRLGTGKIVFNGLGRSYTARHLKNGTTYRFVIVSVDAAGNRSRGVVVRATPQAILLASPKPGQRVSRPPLLRWAPVGKASYFNVQLWRGKQKVLSAWPSFARYQLQRSWRYDGKRFALTPGVYTWYVWPGIGAKAAVKYGPLLGSRTFVVVKAPAV
jgi:hypothetical protein